MSNWIKTSARPWMWIPPADEEFMSFRLVKVLRNIAIVSKYYLPIPSQKGGAKTCHEGV